MLQSKKYSYVTLFQVKSDALKVVNNTNTIENNPGSNHTLLTECFTNGKYSLPVTAFTSDQSSYIKANEYATLNRKARRIKMIKKC